jgi:very-short-patch-repair endonuclease
MALRQEQNRSSSRRSEAERWMDSLLAATPWEWTRQAMWGYRVFDFWQHHLGCAIEVDGPEHDADYDSYRDEYNFRRSAIVVLRVPNMDERAASWALARLHTIGSHGDRKLAIGIAGSTKQVRRSLLALPYPPSLLADYLRLTRPGGRPSGRA